MLKSVTRRVNGLQADIATVRTGKDFLSSSKAFRNNMCGIAGIFDFKNKVEALRVKKMTDAIAWRGPDGEGNWLSANEKLCLGHRRLSIIDLSERARQPMHYINRYTLVFNGELYNYKELRADLIQLGMQFQTDSDTEVALAAFHHYRENCLQHFDGMFAFAIWDEQDKKLFCARDRFGEKPFFYTNVHYEEFHFASEMKALMLEEKPEVNRKMLFNYMAYNVSQNPNDQSETFFKNIFKLEPAHYLLIDEAGQIEKKCYWKIDTNKQVKISEEEAKKKFRELFFQSVERRLRSDVPIGSSLSGGVDSSSIVCAIGKLNGENPFPQNTFSARFNEPDFDEGKFIDKVAAQTPLNKHEVWVNEEVLFTDLQNVIYHIEEPLSNSSPLAQWKVMQLAKEKNVIVLLDGQGADETLAGYLHFFKPYFAELFLKDKKNYHEQLLQYKKLRGIDFDADGKFENGIKYKKFFSVLGKTWRKISTPSYLSFLNEDFIRENKNENPPFKVFTKLNDSLKFFSTEFGLEKLLTYADRNSMAFSREIRLPFLSHELVEFIFSLPIEMKIINGWTKFILRKSMEEIIPETIAWRIDKLGYQPPINSWLQQPKAQQMIIEAKDFLVERKLIRKNMEIKGHEWMLLNTALFLKAFNQ